MRCNFLMQPVADGFFCRPRFRLRFHVNLPLNLDGARWLSEIAKYDQGSARMR